MTGADLRARREALNLSQPKLAALLKVSVNTINRWENEKMQIGNPAILDLALKYLESQQNS